MYLVLFRHTSSLSISVGLHYIVVLLVEISRPNQDRLNYFPPFRYFLAIPCWTAGGNASNAARIAVAPLSLAACTCFHAVSTSASLACGKRPLPSGGAARCCGV